MSRSPEVKRIKLESPETPRLRSHSELDKTTSAQPGDDEEVDHCIICLQDIVDRTVLPTCCHDRLCFECITIWTEQSRKCPLCSALIGPYLIHNIRSELDYQKHFLYPLKTSPPPLQRPTRAQLNAATRHRREPPWGRSRQPRTEESDALERAIEMRRWVYRHHLYAKHVASNSFTRYRPYPSPSQFNASQDLVSRTTAFVRRELQVWVNLDVEFLTTLIISLLRTIDIRSEPAIKLLSDFLDMDLTYTEGGRKKNAEHFAHELYCFLRSPYRDLAAYDSVVQYDVTEDIPPPSAPPRGERWNREHDSGRRNTSPQRSRRSREARPLVSRSPPRQPPSRSHSPAYSPRDREDNDANGHENLQDVHKRSRQSPAAPASRPETRVGLLEDVSNANSIPTNCLDAPPTSQSSNGEGKARQHAVDVARHSLSTAIGSRTINVTPSDAQPLEASISPRPSSSSAPKINPDIQSAQATRYPTDSRLNEIRIRGAALDSRNDRPVLFDQRSQSSPHSLQETPRLLTLRAQTADHRAVSNTPPAGALPPAANSSRTPFFGQTDGLSRMDAHGPDLTPYVTNCADSAVTTIPRPGTAEALEGKPMPDRGSSPILTNTHTTSTTTTSSQGTSFNDRKTSRQEGHVQGIELKQRLISQDELLYTQSVAWTEPAVSTVSDPGAKEGSIGSLAAPGSPDTLCPSVDANPNQQLSTNARLKMKLAIEKQKQENRQITHRTGKEEVATNGEELSKQEELLRACLITRRRVGEDPNLV